MTEQTATPILDLVQQIAAALSRTGTPKTDSLEDVDMTKGTVLGSLPEHLRHLHNFLDELLEKAQASEKRYTDLAAELAKEEVVLKNTVTQLEAAQGVFRASTQEYVDTTGCDALAIVKNWDIIGLKHDRKTVFMDLLNQMRERRRGSALMGGFFGTSIFDGTSVTDGDPDSDGSDNDDTGDELDDGDSGWPRDDDGDDDLNDGDPWEGDDLSDELDDPDNGGVDLDDVFADRGDDPASTETGVYDPGDIEEEDSSDQVDDLLDPSTSVSTEDDNLAA